MAVMHWSAKSRAHYTKNHVSGGTLKVPRTPVERIMLGAKLKRLKADHLKRLEQRGS